MKFKKAMVPSLFTLFNMFAGFFAIISIANGIYPRAIWLIFFAAVFDGLDGKLARFIGTSSDFGIELDSMADMVSFCIAPALLVYQLYSMEFGILGAFIAFFPILFGGIRLARFNVQVQETPISYFIGLPTPMNAIALIAFPLYHFATSHDPGQAGIFLPYMISLSFLMVSHIPYPKMPNFSLEKDLSNLLKLSGLTVSIIILFLFPARALLFLSLLFIFSGIIRWMAATEDDEEIVEPLTK